MEASNPWHYSDDAEISDEANSIYIMRVLEHFTDEFQTLYKLEQELSLDDALEGPNCIYSIQFNRVWGNL